METKFCNTCSTEKSVDNFYKRGDSTDGYRSKCKDCYYIKTQENKRKRMRVDFETNGYVIYYLPEENYIGMTNNLQRRLWHHSSKGRIVEGFEVVMDGFKSPIMCHHYENLLHLMGYNGFAYNEKSTIF